MEVENGEGMEQDAAPAEKTERKVYLPGKPLDKGEVLECDESVYLMRHECKAGKVSYKCHPKFLVSLLPTPVIPVICDLS